MKGLPGPVLADVAANVLAMTLMVLIAIARLTQTAPPVPPPIALTAHPVAPVGGATAVELLRQRLLPEATGFADIDASAAPVPPDATILFILDPKSYPAALSRLSAQSDPRQELTVPAALKTADNLWHPDFLDLARFAANPDQFRTGLQLLLTRAPKDGAKAVAGAIGAGSPGLSLRFGLWFRAALDALGLAALFGVIWGLTRLRRWAIKA